MGGNTDKTFYSWFNNHRCNGKIKFLEEYTLSTDYRLLEDQYFLIYESQSLQFQKINILQ